MKRALVTLLTTFIILSALSGAFAADIKREAGYISLNASKSIDVDPNIARVSFAVENTAETAKKASDENNISSNNIINALKLITDSKTDVIKTTNFSVRPVYATNKDGKRVIKNYTAANSITVETKNISNISNLIDTAIEKGANRTEGLSYTYENQDSTCQSIYPELLANLKTQAVTMAQSVGSSIDGIKHISTSCSMQNSFSSNGRFLYAKAAMEDAGASDSTTSAPIEAGKVKVNVYISVDFYVK